MNITREQVIAWAREADREWDCDRYMVEWLEWFAALAYAAGAATIKDAPDYKMGYADGAAVECDKFNKERQQYADWFDEAAADIYDWGGYASEYFQEKYDLQANVRDFKNRAVAIRARNNP